MTLGERIYHYRTAQSLSQTDLAEQLDATFSYLVNSDFFEDDIKEYLGTDTIGGTMKSQSIEGSNLITLTTYSSSPEKAGALLEIVLSTSLLFAGAACCGRAGSEL